VNDRRNLLQESLAAIERLQARLDASERRKRAPIAIIGAGCRFSGGVMNPDDLWTILRDGVDAVGDVPPERWDVEAYHDPTGTQPGKMRSIRGGFLRDIDQFDTQFFGIAPREATELDPQQRLLLECSHEALERAGLAVDRLAGSTTGVFVGVSTVEYSHLSIANSLKSVDTYAANGASMNAVAGRLSFTYGFLGPCVAVDTACSSSLVAVHLACQSLRTGESDLALACGVNVILKPDGMVLFSRWGLMAGDGVCKTFDADADGFVRSEGCGVLVLKRLDEALADGDPVLAVIRGTACNSDGRSSGITVPNGPAQEAVIRTALRSGGLTAADIDYVEAHGTGTPIGDPIEVEAIANALGAGHSAEKPLLIGSVKSNLGHPESAAGMAGLLKVVLALQNEAIPRQRHFKSPNPRIAWESMPVAVTDRHTPWPRGPRVRRAGVSGFGFSGTNAHVILEEAPAAAAPPQDGRALRPVLIPLSARTEPALRQLAAAHADRLAAEEAPELDDVAATLGSGRTALSRRLAVLANDVTELADELRGFADGTPGVALASGSARPGERPKIGFLFTGQGAQYAGMGRVLYDTEPVFRDVIDRADGILASYRDRSLTAVLFPDDGAGTSLNDTTYTQPALYALQCGLVAVWRSWGIEPAIVAGHSVGEYAAACAAGVFSFEDGLRLIAERGALMGALPPGGAMAALFAAESRVSAAVTTHGLGNRLSIAALNGPEETVVSGEAEALAALLAVFAAEGIECRRLEVSHAFHSALMDPMLDALEQRARAVVFAAPTVPLVSNLTGAAFPTGRAPDAAYWRRHARDPVRFTACVDALKAAGVTALVEIGPHPTLLGLAGRAVPGAGWAALTSLRRGRDDRREMLTTLGALFVRGAEVDWSAQRRGQPGRRVALPTYPWQRERYWVKAAPQRRTLAGHPLLGERQWAPGQGAQFLSLVGRSEPAFVADHVVLDHVLLPGTSFVEMGLAAGRALGLGETITIRQFGIEAPLALPDDAPRPVHTLVEPDAGGTFRVAVRSAAADTDPARQRWRQHAKFVLSRGGSLEGGPALSVAEAEARCDVPVDTAALYTQFERAGLRYGPAFRCVHSVRCGPGAAVGLIELRPDMVDREITLHPALLDCAFHVLGAALLHDRKDQDDDPIYVPAGIETLTLRCRGLTRLRVAVTLMERNEEERYAYAALRLEDESGTVVGRLDGLHVQRVDRSILARSLAADGIETRTFQPVWRPVSGTGAALGADPIAIVADAGGFAERLATALSAHGIRSTLLPDVSLTAASLATVLRDGSGHGRVIDCRPLDLAPAAANLAAAGAASASADPTAAVATVYGRTLALAQALGAAAPRAGLCLLTRGAQAVDPGDDVALAETGLSGLVRVLAVENPDARHVRIDLDPSVPLDPRPLLDALGVAGPDEPELALRRGAILGKRLVPVPTPAADAESRRVLRIAERGDLDRLALAALPRVAPRGQEVEIAVRAAGLNFRDVLNALGMYPGDAGALGSECSGIVTAVGPAVTRFRPGDAVIALAGESLASHVTVSDALVVPKPGCLSFAGAVTLPNTYLTAALCFSTYARLTGERLGPGKRVLVHAAAGGVGMAAVHLARALGAEVIATAGTPEKRAFVRAQGAAHCFDSRTLDFAPDVLAVTGGTGVDCVVNSLADAFIDAGMRVVRPGGAFVEIGKKGWTADEAAERAPHVRYRVVDLGEEIARDVAAVRAEFERVVGETAAGRLPVLPLQVFPLAEAPTAFRFMASARHIGKVVLEPEADGNPVQPRADGTYLVTGGLGGLGLTVAAWLAERGAGHIVLVGRRGAGPADEPVLADLRARGAAVTALACDVSDEKAVADLWRGPLAALPPLRGIVHAAGVLKDAPVELQDASRFAAVAGPKADGAWRLHAASLADPLDFFLLFSSTSALFGSPGQANYATANAFLDGLAAYRRLRGLPAASIAWGAWDEVGMAASLPASQHAAWAQAGVGLMPRDAALSAMDTVLRSGLAQAAAAALDLDRLAGQAGPGMRALLGVDRAVAAPEPEANGKIDVAHVLAASGATRDALLRDFVHGEAARVLGFKPQALDADTPLTTLGFDSLMAVQFRQTVSTHLNIDLPLRELLRGPTIARLVDDIAGRLPLIDAAEAEPEMAWEEGTI
jgi:acyl transferase domain-containing protein/NADPH:quinone reductase-like Zn-dependent oxidoreductase/acyl carrier protein